MAKYSVNHIERKIILTKEFASDAKRLEHAPFEPAEEEEAPEEAPAEETEATAAE